MINPPEKATSLFTQMKGFRVKHSHSKKCALVAAELMLSFIEDHVHEWHGWESDRDCWREVVSELKNKKTA